MTTALDFPRTLTITPHGQAQFRFGFSKELSMKLRNALYDAHWNGTLRAWCVRVRAANVRKIADFARQNEFSGVEAVEAAQERLFDTARETIVASRAEDADFTPPATLQGTLRPFQRAGVAFAVNAKRCLLADEMGLGKEQSVNSLAMTPAGYRRIGDLQIGDAIIGGSTGKTQVVTGIFPQGFKQLFKITFKDDTWTLAGLDHLWTVRDDNDYRRRKQFWRTVTTRCLLESGLTVAKTKPRPRWEIPLPPVIHFPKASTPIHPYLLGALIGNGCVLNGCKLSTRHPQQLQIVRKLLPEGLFLHGPYPSDPNQYAITTHQPGTRKHPLIEPLKSLGLYGKRDFEKRIPEIYLFSTAHDRRHRDSMNLPIQSREDLNEFVRRFALETYAYVRMGMMTEDQQLRLCQRFLHALILHAEARLPTSVGASHPLQ